jgi:ABC-2 type transporter
MTGLSHNALHFFKFLLILILYTVTMTLWVSSSYFPLRDHISFCFYFCLSDQNFFLGSFFRNGGIAILISALSTLYQMTYSGFFVHLNSIPPVLRWLQWICPLKFALEAMSVNEVTSGLIIQDTLEGVPVSVSASLIMNTVCVFCFTFSVI